jgi:serine/threonine-protein kinase RsbW
VSEIGASAEQVDDIVLALDEACANVVRHAYGEGEAGEFRLVADISDDEVSIAVEDDGVGMSATPAEADVDVDAVSGRGLQIIRRLMTDLEVSSPTERGSGTRVQMHKRLTHTV